MSEQTKAKWGANALGGQLQQDRLNRELRERLKPSILADRYFQERKSLTRRDRIGLWVSDWKGRFVLAWRALCGEDLE